MRKLAGILVFAAVALIIILFFWFSKTDDMQTLVVYSGRGEALVGDLLQQFEQESGVKLDVRYNATAPLATQILHEGSNTPADIVFFQESGYLGLLAHAGLLRPIAPALLQQVDETYRDPGGKWLGTSGRLRVLAYNSEKLAGDDLPETLQDLSDPEWRQQFGWVPSNASMQAHVSALRELWGEQTLKTWLRAVKANLPRQYASNAQIVNAIASNEILIGWTNHYYLYRLKQQRLDLPVENYNFPPAGKAGNLFIISGAGITASSTKPALAEQLLAFLISEQGQNYFTEQGFEYPTRTDYAVNEKLPDLSTIDLADVPQSVLTNVTPTVVILEELNLL